MNIRIYNEKNICENKMMFQPFILTKSKRENQLKQVGQYVGYTYIKINRFNSLEIRELTHLICENN